MFLTPPISVVTVSYRTGDILFESLAAQLADPLVREVVVVDNGNDSPTRARLARLAEGEKRLRILEGQGNVGFSAGCNLGASVARGEYLAFVNPDCIVRPDCHGLLLQTLRADPSIWLISPRLEAPDGSPERGTPRSILTPWTATVESLHLWRLAPNHPTFRRLNLYATDAYWQRGYVPAISGAYMLIARDRFERLGGFDERYFMHVEDLDFCLAVARAGGSTFYEPAAAAVHHRGSSRVSAVTIEWRKMRGARYYMNKNFRTLYPRWFMALVKAMIVARFAFVAAALLVRAPFRARDPAR